MKHRNISTRAAAASPGSPGVLGQLESEIAELRRMNARLQERLEQAEMDAELQVRADRILAISPPTHA